MSIDTTVLQTHFATELQRLLSLGLSPELETIARRYYSDKERDAMESEDFAGPHQSFPIKTQQDVHNAANLIGHADNPDSVKSAIKRIAKRKGFALPDSWQEEEENTSEDDTKERTITPLNIKVAVDGVSLITATTNNSTQATLTFNRATGNHDPFTGKHSHPHPAHGSQGDDETHSHEHSHDNDADHGHSHADTADDSTQDRSVSQAITPESLSVYLPITRVDATSRTVTGQATVEKPDAYGTIFGYYPDAWLKWRGNMREQHDPKKAVGKAIEVVPDDQERAIYVTSKVSRGAQDTWLKIEDGVLTGYSASIIPDPEFGNDIRKWPKRTYEGKEYPYLPRYTVAETSYVDNPATPGCNISLVRADGMLSEVVDVEEPAPEQRQETQDRAGARVGKGTQSANHTAIAHTLHAAVAQMKNCKDDCPQCQAAMKMIDPDGDGDIDLGGYDDPDGNSDSLYKSQTDDMERVVTTLIERSLQPVYTRLQGIAGSLARSNTQPAPINLEQIITSSITRAFEALDEKFSTLPTSASLAEVRADLSAVKEQVAKIAEQPMPGGPVLNANAVLPRAIEKQLPTDPPLMMQPRQSYGSVYDAIASMSRAGQLDTQDKQVDAMTAGLIAQRGRR